MEYPQEHIFDIEKSQIYQNVKKLDLTGADSLFISCTGLNTTDIIEALEEDLNLPVITSNQAILWGTYRKIGIGKKFLLLEHSLQFSEH